MKSNTDINKYISDRLQNLNTLDSKNVMDTNMVEYIYQALTTSKYRRHSISTEYKEHIRAVVINSVKDNRPIPLVWVFGCYKLWRLSESPYVDWAELFFLMHKVDWLKPILSVYKPGIWFDFFADGLLVPRLNNFSETDMEKYKESFLKLLSFHEKYIPRNLNFTLHTLEELYGSKKAFSEEFENNLKEVERKDRKTPFILTEQQQAIIQMNVKTEKKLSADDLHKNQLMFEAFCLSSKRRPYYRTPEKIFIDSFPIKNTLPIGATRTSAVRFWVSAGALQKYEDSYIEVLLSTRQLEGLKPNKQSIEVKGLTGRNFKSIYLLK